MEELPRICCSVYALRPFNNTRWCFCACASNLLLMLHFMLVVSRQVAAPLWPIVDRCCHRLVLSCTTIWRDMETKSRVIVVLRVQSSLCRVICGRDEPWEFEVTIKNFRIIHAYTHVPMYIHTYMHARIHAYLRTYVRTCVRACVRACVRSIICSFVHMYVHTYLHTYLHT
jgi:hypothetical protein